MTTLTDVQQTELRDLLEQCRRTTIELDESLETGRMSDAKSFVYDVLQKAGQLSLPEAHLIHLQQLAQEAWHGTSSAGGDTIARACKGLAGIGAIESCIRELLGEK